ncbi:mannose-6-phosphate isomerase [Pseudalgibacter alginicilyticus]|uniref:mannose-6-phosphate isomerase n=1 Tax=Pseudalgibacter alginicilyticus TaxID=1736674 RepID=A0A0P0CCN4_9FLAO|nr:mannose-6-phosphate isomerase, class I [Pseudalgibacter alginicilyticus]ALJ03732.1 mannose-6-phosphate isomerase [Pseudalgibacter alginicilyticus]
MSKNTTNLFALKGKIQNYAWGGKQFIPELLGMEANDEKCAEYWLGAHANAPSTILTTEGNQSLNDFLKSNLVASLGSEVVNKFGRLPFLFKVLDVHDMLSIQVHPSKKEAEKGFKNENDLGIPITAPHRNYKDDNHKPEIMVALSEFWLLHGFLPKNQLIQRLKNTPEFVGLLPIFEKESYYGLYKKVMEQSQEASNKMLAPLVERIMPLYLAGKLDKSSPDYWAAKAVDSAEDKTLLDKGIYSIYFFNILKANKGEAIFQDAGIPHAYLEGQNMELMANSDNVLRGGLTPKHIDVPELLKHITFEETIPNIMQGTLQDDGLERIYKTIAPDFELSKIDISSVKAYQSQSKTAQIIMIIEGQAEIKEGNTVLTLKKGESAFLKAQSVYSISTLTSAIIYKATAP